MRRYARSSFPVLATLALAAWAERVSAQQIIEIDYENGRDVINDDMRAMTISTSAVAVDHVRGILHVQDPEEPEGVMAFSINTGEWLKTYRVGVGGGPDELPERRHLMALADHGGLYVSDGRKFLHLDSDGEFSGYWQPVIPLQARTMCVLGGQPTVVVEGGLRRRGPDGNDQLLGAGAVEEDWVLASGTLEGILVAIDRITNQRLACTEDAAYSVLWTMEVRDSTVTSDGRVSVSHTPSGPDSVLVYSLDGAESRIEVPTEFADEDSYPWNRHMDPSIDMHGDLVLASGDGDTPGAVIDPQTRCYAVIRNPDYQMYREFITVVRDSALIFHRDREETMADGKKYVTLYSDARQASLYPLRRVSGEPCPGMLPSVGGPDTHPPETDDRVSSRSFPYSQRPPAGAPRPPQLR